MRIAVFCEARGDFSTATGLAERVFREEGPAWVADLYDSAPLAVREWIPDSRGNDFFDIHRTRAYAGEIALPPIASFDGGHRSAGALMLRTILSIVRELQRGDSPRRAPVEIDGLIVVWDMDDDGDARRDALQRAREERRDLHEGRFAVVLGCPDPMCEAWILAGFEPEDDAERERLSDLRRELGFSPADEAHRLAAKKETAKRSPKRVLEALTNGDPERESRCWTETPLAMLRARGQQSGLRAYLDEIRDRLLPLFSRP